MAREIEEYEEVKSFIQDVTEQIQYRPIRPEIKEELLSHIEDRVDEYENAGESRDNAIKTTVLQMGETGPTVMIMSGIIGIIEGKLHINGDILKQKNIICRQLILFKRKIC